MTKNVVEHRRVAKQALKLIKPDHNESDIILMLLAMNIAFCDGRMIGFEGAIKK